jgi:hypothetical protein
MEGASLCSAGGLSHLHNRGLHETDRHHVATNAAHHDAIAHAEILASQNDKVSRHRRDDPLWRDRQAGRDQRSGRRQPARVVEPDGQQTHDDHGADENMNRLPNPEMDLLPPLSEYGFRQQFQKTAKQGHSGDEQNAE